MPGASMPATLQHKTEAYPCPEPQPEPGRVQRAWLGQEEWWEPGGMETGEGKVTAQPCLEQEHAQLPGKQMWFSLLIQRRGSPELHVTKPHIFDR